MRSSINDSVSPANPSLIMIPLKIKLLKQEYKEDKRRVEKEVERLQGELGDMKLSNDFQRDEIQEITKDRNNFFENFKRLG